MKKLSLIVPVLNEALNIKPLVERINWALSNNNLGYEIIFIDDNSTDDSKQIIEHLNSLYPIKFFSKKGACGKAQSIIEGFEYASYPLVGFIDADLQYPPEAIPEMINKIEQGTDIVIANRATRETRDVRSKLSILFNNYFIKILGFNVDVQSGLKLFRKEVLYGLKLNPTKWGFDYEFLHKAHRMGWDIDSVDIAFSDRMFGTSKVNPWQTGVELATGVLKLKAKSLLKQTFKFFDYPHHSEKNPINFKNSDDFLFIPEIHATKKHIFPETISLTVFATIILLSILYLLKNLFNLPFIITISGGIALFYFAFMLFKLIVVYQSVNRPLIKIDTKEIESLTNSDLPIYTILIPLYKEAQVIPQIIEAMSAIDYPINKLDIIITLEEYDHETIKAIKDAEIPSYFKTLILPNVEPKTKPKALNVAFLQAKGVYLVIYDAEIIPDPDQLKKAYLAFSKNPNLASLQTRLDHYNTDQSVITRLFNAEFSFYYDLFLPGLQKLNLPIPLSGHSTHFKKSALESIGAWDPYNVTEDCDIGMRLHKMGYKTDILDTFSKEEATSNLITWIKQRTRWMKGFIQTSIVHLRYPTRFKNELGGWGNFIGFILVVPATVVINVFNLLYWFLFIIWVITKSTLIQSFFPGPILYLSIISFVLGNAIFTYLNLLGAYKRNRYSLVKYCLLSPIYWILLAIATVRAIIQVIVAPHQWEKTTHGQHIKDKQIVLDKNYALAKS